jgi:TolA-binding protein
VAGTQVQVFEGEVAVSAPHMRAVAMHAGETRLFASDDTGALDAPPPELLSEACTLLESLDDRLVCLNEESRGSGLRAQAALYERAWLQAENGQPDGAAATLFESIKRFPEGPLQPEARLALLRALLAGNRRSEAVEAARSFVSACPDDPRVPKVEAFVLALEWAGSR